MGRTPDRDDPRPYTEAQHAKIVGLADDKALPDPNTRTAAEAAACDLLAVILTQPWADKSPIRLYVASLLIDWLIGLPFKPGRQPAEPGYYRRDGLYLLVVPRKRTAGTYAKVLAQPVPGRWVAAYDPELASSAGLTDEHRLSGAEVTELGLHKVS